MRRIVLVLFIFILSSCTSDTGTHRGYVISQTVKENELTDEQE